MTYSLLGSKTSPFVRRIRLLMEHIPYDFKELNIFEATDGAYLQRVNPINQIPVLVHHEKTIWDSRIIFNYLNSIHQFQRMNWEDENRLTAIDGAMNSGVSLLLMQRSGINTQEPLMYVGRQRERITSILDYLAPFMKESQDWNFHTMSLYAFLDWATFREIINLDQRPDCRSFLEKFQAKPIVQQTSPRS